MRSEELKAFQRTEGWKFILEKLNEWEANLIEEFALADDLPLIYRNQGILRAIRVFKDMPNEEASAASD